MSKKSKKSPKGAIVPAVTDATATLSAPRGTAPIFIHSSFRTSSTWLWNKLRSTPDVVAYYEVFHEALATMDVKQAVGLTHSTWQSKHPPSAPYFLEYLPLFRPGGGICAYDPSMALDRFIPAGGMDGGLSATEHAYIDGLLRNADANRKIPVLTFCRSLGRTRALHEAYGGTAVLLYRNLFHQWASYSHQALAGNDYFMKSVDAIIAASRHDPFIRRLDDWFSTRVASPHDEQMFLTFLILHLYLYARTFDVADIVIDVSALGADDEARLSAERDLSKLVRSSIDLSDATLRFEQSAVSIDRPVEFVDTLEQFAKYIAGTCTTTKSIAFLHRVKDQALREWDRHEFFTRRARSFHLAELADTRGQRDRLDERLAQTTAARDALQQAATAQNSERDDLAARLVEMTSARDALQLSVAGLSDEKNRLAAELAETATARDALQHDVAGLTGERDRLGASLSDAAGARDALRETVMALIGERDRLVADGERRQARSLAGRMRTGIRASASKAGRFFTR